MQGSLEWRLGWCLSLQKQLKTTTEISRFKFLFVTLFYCLYDICIVRAKVRLLFFLEVHAKIEHDCSVARAVECVVADVGKADVVGQVGVEHVVADAATYAQTTVKTAEVVAVERAFSLALGKVLDLAAYAHSKVSAHEGLQREVIVNLVLVFYNHRNFQIVQVVGHFLAIC